jgi:alpha-amylase/alpha-mannosidase (GH57 family)
MDRYLCIHCHFYQPPRENPWLEAIEIQDSAYPYHDWNERVTVECYAPNHAARILDGEGRIKDIISNYARVSFNFGPTLLSWMEKNSPGVYQAILEADRKSQEWRSGHGAAIAQCYNHLIMPLANRRDKRTQILWGIRDFQQRFGRDPEGMWLPETAVDLETLDLLAEARIRFTILAPHQAKRFRKIGSRKWEDVTGGKIDPTRAYRCRLSPRRQMTLFFYDGPISRAVAFEGLLEKGENFVHRLLNGFSEARDWPQLLHIATDGETYGHHHKFGDMALAYSLHDIESNGLAQLTNYGEYLEKYPPLWEAEIVENTSWSCCHGIERWRSHCGCSSGGHPGWNQEWRSPLRQTLDGLRDQLSSRYEQKAKEYLKDPWKARDDYIDIILDRSRKSMSRFFKRHALRNLSAEEGTLVLKLLELQRHSMLMYTSCGWFFDELSGLETVQVMHYADRTVQLSSEVFGEDLEPALLQQLANARSNLPDHKDGARIYEKFVKPGRLDLKKVGVHYAVSSLFEDYPEETNIYCYDVKKEDYRKTEAGKIELAIGRVQVSSQITRESELVTFCILHLGNHDFNGGVRTFLGEEVYQTMKEEVRTGFEKGAFADVVRLMDKHFGMHHYSLKGLFKDEQRKILDLLIKATLDDFESAYRQMYENNRILMGFLQEARFPISRPFLMAAEFTLNLDMRRALEGQIDIDKIKTMMNDIEKWNVALDAVSLEFILRHQVEKEMRRFLDHSSDLTILEKIEKLLTMAFSLPFELNLWEIQNIYYGMGKAIYPDFVAKAREGDDQASRWIEGFRSLGQKLSFNLESILPPIHPSPSRGEG